MWLVSLISSGFSLDIPQSNYILFSKLFLVACFIKFFVETSRGYFSLFDEGKYIRELYMANTKFPMISVALYKTLYIFKFVALGLLFFEQLRFFSLLILLVSFLVEIRIYFKFHTNYFLLITFSLLFANNHGLSQTMIVTLTCIMYISTALKKINPSFLTGKIVSYTMNEIYNSNDMRQFTDTPYLSKLYKSAMLPLLNNEILLKYLMKLTILLELLIPLLLLSPFYKIGVALGLILHGGFCLISFATLFHFGLVTAITYMLFINPMVN